MTISIPVSALAAMCLLVGAPGSSLADPPTLGDQARALRDGREPPRHVMAPARAAITSRRLVEQTDTGATLELTRADGSIEHHTARYFASARPARAQQARADAELLATARTLQAIGEGLATPDDRARLAAEPWVVSAAGSILAAQRGRADNAIDPLSAAAGAFGGALAGLGAGALRKRSMA